MPKKNSIWSLLAVCASTIILIGVAALFPLQKKQNTLVGYDGNNIFSSSTSSVSGVSLSAVNAWSAQQQFNAGLTFTTGSGTSITSTNAFFTALTGTNARFTNITTTNFAGLSLTTFASTTIGTTTLATGEIFRGTGGTYTYYNGNGARWEYPYSVNGAGANNPMAALYNSAGNRATGIWQDDSNFGIAGGSGVGIVLYGGGTLGLQIDSAGVVVLSNAKNKSTCTLDGAATSKCTITVSASCTPICGYNSSTTPHTISCQVVGTTLTAVSATTLDSGVVNAYCL